MKRDAFYHVNSFRANTNNVMQPRGKILLYEYIITGTITAIKHMACKRLYVQYRHNV
jgi:hypothetical protein